MRALHAASLITVFALVGCDRITGESDQKALDAKAVGYACRVSLKAPEDCMKENEAHSPSYVLSGWKEADKDINERLIDPNMGKTQPQPPAPAAAPSAPATNPNPAKAAADMPGKPEAAKKANH